MGKSPQTKGNSLNGWGSPELLNKKLSRAFTERKAEGAVADLVPW